MRSTRSHAWSQRSLPLTPVRQLGCVATFTAISNGTRLSASSCPSGSCPWSHRCNKQGQTCATIFASGFPPFVVTLQRLCPACLAYLPSRRRVSTVSERNMAQEPIILRISGGYRRFSTPSVYAFAPTVPEMEPILADDGFDRNCWTSVFEHVRVPSAVVAEAVRVLKPGGLFILTIDLDMSGVFAIDVDGHARLCAAIREHFTYLYPKRTVHPAETSSGPTGRSPQIARDQSGRGGIMLSSLFSSRCLAGGQCPCTILPYRPSHSRNCGVSAATRMPRTRTNAKRTHVIPAEQLASTDNFSFFT
ncbi:exported hypothetical protein [Candidatus Defluviicoccus seviourii]|uniref:Methyltransferase type 11 domain-containing protein n=1 Tax=Candidatus Defluviicoccus seviourii TaxID=2565273 RepID=A0A564WCV4_9PROT|nr:exported hypothetical protein [Candidatus Defluviicoccus seviourii]